MGQFQGWSRKNPCGIFQRVLDFDLGISVPEFSRVFSQFCWIYRSESLFSPEFLSKGKVVTNPKNSTRFFRKIHPQPPVWIFSGIITQLSLAASCKGLLTNNFCHTWDKSDKKIFLNIELTYIFLPRQ